MLHMIQAILCIALLIGGIAGIAAMLLAERERIGGVLGHGHSTTLPPLPIHAVRRSMTAHRTARVAPFNRPVFRAAA